MKKITSVQCVVMSLILSMKPNDQMDLWCFPPNICVTIELSIHCRGEASTVQTLDYFILHTKKKTFLLDLIVDSFKFKMLPREVSTGIGIREDWDLFPSRT